MKNIAANISRASLQWSLIAMGGESLPAINAQQFYVSVSRGRERATIFTDLSKEALTEAIKKTDTRQSATELLGEKTKPRRLRDRARAAYYALRDKIIEAIQHQRSNHNGRS